MPNETDIHASQTAPAQHSAQAMVAFYAVLFILTLMVGFSAIGIGYKVAIALLLFLFAIIAPLRAYRSYKQIKEIRDAHGGE